MWNLICDWLIIILVFWYKMGTILLFFFKGNLKKQTYQHIFPLMHLTNAEKTDVIFKFQLLFMANLILFMTRSSIYESFSVFIQFI